MTPITLPILIQHGAQQMGGSSTAQRQVFVNGQTVTFLSFPTTGAWADDIWGLASISLNVPTGASVRLDHVGDDGDNTMYIDLDELVVS